MEIGIYSGSFNPPHTGHAILASYIAQCGIVDKVWLLLTPDNPLKKHPKGTPSETVRLNMLKMLSSGCPSRLEASDFELSLPRPNYTANTLKHLREQYPQHRFSLIIGADNWLIFDNWRDYKQIIENHRLIIYPRPGCEINNENLPENAVYLKNAPQIEISSTQIRNDISLGKNQNFFLTQEVWQYIRDTKLYIRQK